MFKFFIGSLFGLVVLFIIGFIILCSGIVLVKKAVNNTEVKGELSPLTKLKLEDWEEVDPR